MYNGDLNRRDIAVLAFKLFGFYFMLSIVRWIEQIGQNWWMIASLYTSTSRSRGEILRIAIPLFVVAIVVALGILIWRNAGKLADRVFPTAEQNTGAIAITAEDMLKVFLGVIGVWLMAAACPEIITDSIVYLAVRHSVMAGAGDDVGSVRANAGLIAGGVRFLVGMLLVFWRPLGKFVHSALFFARIPDSPLPVHERSTDSVCPYCKSLLHAPVIYCSRCGTRHHELCWSEHGTCGVYGCAENST